MDSVFLSGRTQKVRLELLRWEGFIVLTNNKRKVFKMKLFNINVSQFLLVSIYKKIIMSKP
jgi:hypothetical protein